jgi:hypothetical protein
MVVSVVAVQDTLPMAVSAVEAEVMERAASVVAVGRMKMAVLVEVVPRVQQL